MDPRGKIMIIFRRANIGPIVRNYIVEGEMGDENCDDILPRRRDES